MDIFSLLELVGRILPEKWRPIVGGLFLLYLVYSQVIDLLNGYVRKSAEAGVKLPLLVLRILAALNVPAMNATKAKQLWDGYRGPSARAGTSPVAVALAGK